MEEMGTRMQNHRNPDICLPFGGNLHVLDLGSDCSRLFMEIRKGIKPISDRKEGPLADSQP